MKRLILNLLVVIFLYLPFSLNAQKIENLRIKKLDNKINVFFDITQEKAGQLFDVEILCSNNQGVSYNVPINTLSGDVGNNIEGGLNKLII